MVSHIEVWFLLFSFFMACGDKKQTGGNDWPVGKKKKKNPQNKQRQIVEPIIENDPSF